MTWMGDRRGALLASLGLALLLTILPAPAWLHWFQPYWVALVLIYWALEDQRSVSLGFAFLTGVLMDLLTASLLGLHALSLVILVYLVQRFRARLRFFPPWQQAGSVLALLLNDRIIQLWIAKLIGEPTPAWDYWLPPLAGTFIWPFLFLILDRFRAGLRHQKSG